MAKIANHKAPHSPKTDAAPADRRQDILNAALHIAMASGLDAVSIEGVRAQCGASVGSIYHHFGSKDAILAALFFDIFNAQSRALQAQLSLAKGLEEGTYGLVTGYLDWVVANPERARFMFQARSVVASGPRGAELAELAETRKNAVLQWLTPWLADATGAQRIPCELAPSIVLGPVQSYCRAWLAGSSGLPSPQTYRLLLAEAAWKAIRPD